MIYVSHDAGDTWTETGSLMTQSNLMVIPLLAGPKYGNCVFSKIGIPLLVEKTLTTLMFQLIIVFLLLKVY